MSFLRKLFTVFCEECGADLGPNAVMREYHVCQNEAEERDRLGLETPNDRRMRKMNEKNKQRWE